MDLMLVQVCCNQEGTTRDERVAYNPCQTWNGRGRITFKGYGGGENWIGPRQSIREMGTGMGRGKAVTSRKFNEATFWQGGRRETSPEISGAQGCQGFQVRRRSDWWA